MSPLDDSTVLDLWDRGRRGDALKRAVLLAAAATGADERAAERLSIGERDAAILQLRLASFGRRLEALAACPACGEALEFEVDGTALLDAANAPIDREFSCGSHRFRLPDSRDLRAIATVADAGQGARALLRRCLIDGDGDALSIDDQLLAEADAQLAAADTGADPQLALHCPACGLAWSERLDIASWLWNEVELRAQRLLDEVHCLASAYGWSEPQILALSAPRRRAYLDRCLG